MVGGGPRPKLTGAVPCSLQEESFFFPDDKNFANNINKIQNLRTQSTWQHIGYTSGKPFERVTFSW
jgi:hypothetical protein